jgi:hypothetical protein
MGGKPVAAPQPKVSNKAAALRLAGAGLPIFPCDPANKRPLGGIKWRDESSCDLEIVAACWERWPDAIIGLDVGKAGLLVVDADRHPGAPDGVAALPKLIGGPTLTLRCPVVETAGNGIHLIFRQPEGETFGNSSGALPKGIDVRGQGGYIIAPGSTRADGLMWAARPGSPDLATAFKAATVPVIPEKIAALIRARPERVAAPLPKGGGIGSREHGCAAKALAEDAAKLATHGKGGRNNLLNNVAFTLGTMVTPGWITEGEVHSALRSACEANGLLADDGQASFDATFASGMRKGKDEPRPPLEDRPFANDDADLAEGHKIANVLIEKYGNGSRPKEGGSQAKVTGVAESPRPLFRELAQASSYPVDALGSILSAAAKAIVDRIQCPDALAAQSVLAAASLAVQAHADVEIPATGHVKPTSLFMVSVAGSGERKSAADGEALWPVRKRERALREAYAAEVPEYLKLKAAWDAARKKAIDGTKGDKHAIKGKLDEVGDEPPKPLEPMLTCGEPTFEGLCKILAAGQPAMGIFSDEGGSFIGGHGMSPDAKLRTIAGLSGIWDGSPIKRVRALDGSSIIGGKRVALHLMAQPEAAALMLTDPVLLDQGFLSRVLVSAPASTAGTRFQREHDPASSAALGRYHARILSILECQPAMALDSRNELEPRVLRFAPDAAKAWRDYADHVEGLLAPGQPLESIRGFSNKLPEHAARIAAVLMLVDNIEARHIDLETFERAVRLAEYYTREALRLFEAGYASPELRRAEALRKWLLQHDAPHIGLAEIYQNGPKMVRDAATARAAVAVLVDHGWLVPVAGPSRVKGKSVREAWSIVKEVAR